MRYIVVIILFLTSFVSFSQERLTNIKSGIEATKTFLIEEENKIININIDGTYYLSKILPKGKKELIKVGKIDLNDLSLSRVYFANGHLISIGNRFMSIHNVNEGKTIANIGCPASYAFGIYNIEINKDGILLSLYEKEWELLAKYYFIDFSGNVKVLEHKGFFSNQIGKYAEYKEGYYFNSPVIHGILDVTKDSLIFQMTPNKEGQTLKLTENGLYYMESNNLVKYRNLETGKEEILFAFEADSTRFPSLNIAEDYIVLSAQRNGGEIFTIYDIATKNVVSVSKSFFSGKVLGVFEGNVVSELNRRGLSFINIETGLETLIQNNSSQPSNKIPFYNGVFYYAIESGIVSIRLSDYKRTLAYTVPAERRAISSATLIGDELILNLHQFPTNYLGHLLSIDIKESSVFEYDKETESDYGISNGADFLTIGGKLFLRDNDQLYAVNGNKITLLSKDGYKYFRSSLIYSVSDTAYYFLASKDNQKSVLQFKGGKVTLLFDYSLLFEFFSMLTFDRKFYLSPLNGAKVLYDDRMGKFEIIDVSIRSFGETHDKFYYNFNDTLNILSRQNKHQKILLPEKNMQLISTHNQILIYGAKMYRLEGNELINIKDDLAKPNQYNANIMHQFEDFITFNYGYTDTCRMWHVLSDTISYFDCYETNNEATIYGDENTIIVKSYKNGYNVLHATDQGMEWRNVEDQLNRKELLGHFHFKNNFHTIKASRSIKYDLFIDKWSDDFSSFENIITIEEDYGRRSQFATANEDKIFIKLGSSIYVYDSLLSILDLDINPYSYTEMKIVNDYLYYVGWDKSKGNQLYRLSLKEKPIESDTSLVSEKPTLYPNPCASFINISFLNNNIGMFNIEIINNIGQTVWKRKEYDIDIPINVEQFQSGLYFLKLEANENQTILPFVKI